MGGPSRKGPRPGHVPREQFRHEGGGVVRGAEPFPDASASRPRPQRVTKGKVLERLSGARLAAERADRRLAHQVKQAREFGMSWAEIGAALHRTGQAVGKRYGGG
jgi:hypothetical protein